MISAEQAAAELERRGRLGVKGRPRIMRGPRVALLAKRLEDHRDDVPKLVRDLEGAGARTRRSVFDAVVPGLGRQVAGLFDDAAPLTFQDDWDRRPYRAPRTPDLARRRIVGNVRRVAGQLAPYGPDPVWLARWAGHLGSLHWVSPQTVGWLLARAIDDGDEEVLAILLATVDGTDEVATMGRHVVTALLCSSRPEAWEAVAGLIVAAQREEGLRQTILESVDEAHPEAFRRILAVVLEHDLVRFASFARAISVWLGVEALADDRTGLRAVTVRLAELLDDAEARETALRDGPAPDVFLALWSLATADVDEAASAADGPLRSDDAEQRLVAVRILASLRAPCAVPGLLHALEDEDLRICAVAVDALNAFGGGIPPSYDRIEALLRRLPDRRTPIGAGLWTPGGTLERHDVAKLLAQHRSQPDLDRVLPWVDALEPWHRKTVVAQLALWGTTPAHRAALVARLSDTSPDVREVAIRIVSEQPMSAGEAESLEPLLRRKPGDLRRGVIALLLAQGPAWALRSAERLAASRDAQQRLGGVELFRRLAASDAVEAGAARRRLTELEDTDATVAEAAGRATTRDATVLATEANGFGLFDPAALTPGRPPAKTAWRPDTPAARAVLAGLRELVAAHAATEVEVDHPWDGTTAMTPFGELTSWRLASYRHRSPGRSAAAAEAIIATPPADDGAASGEVPSPGHDRALGSGFPLAAVWDAFARDLPPASRDQDAQHLLRAYVLADRETRAAPTRTAAERLAVAEQVLHALVVAHADAGTVAAALDAAEHELAGLSRKDLRGDGHQGERGLDLPAVDLLRELLVGPVPGVAADVAARSWHLERWLAEPPGVPFPEVRIYGRDEPLAAVGGRFPWRPPVQVVLAAHARGAAPDADLLDHLAGPRGASGFGDLGALSMPGSVLAPGAGARELVLRVRDRVVALELGRGETPTAATDAALALGHSGGGTVLVAALRALGKDRFVRGWSSDGRGRAAAFSHMVSTTRPGDGDDPDTVAAALVAAKLRPARLRELACYAPQWSDHVERALGEPGFADAVWWLHAHTKDDRWYAPDGLAKQWRGEVARRTSLTDAQLVDGAVDVAWFQRVREALGDDGLTAALKAAKYGSTAGGHKRAELFARAMSGTVTEDELLQRITDKRHQDTVRALGLLPLPAAPGERRDAALRRYEALQEFRRGSRAFGNQRRTTEGRATDVGFENLARTAGFRDPVRLTWAMEAQSTADLRGDGVTVALDDLTVTLRVDDDGRPVVAARRGEKALKAVPSAAKKDPEVKALTGRATGLRKQATRVRAALEDAMVRGDALDGDELLGYREHALLWPQLRSVVLVGEGTTGTPGPDGRTLVAHDGTVHAIGHREPLRIAHPRDLLDRGVWPDWQRHVLTARVVQPFKQVFRELYVPTAAEEESPGVSRRYAGHQLQPARTRALLSARGWSVSHEEGVERTDHGLGITAELWFLDGFGSPVEVEPPVLEQVRFRTAREGAAVALSDVPERLFSEVMRDVDLIVSVAHASGVDPEASSSTVEVRAALLRETLDVVGVDNVTIDGPRAVIDGAITRYSVHLGGGTVHTLPGGAVCIVPVHAQQRGRVFLPFADDDPKTAEIISKTLMLARDDKIKDPTILEQLRR